MIKFSFDRGTLVFDTLPESVRHNFPSVKFDERINLYRAPGHSYRATVTTCISLGLEFCDEAKNYTPIVCELSVEITPRKDQSLALDAWLKGGKQGVVSLPTGAGKTILAVMAIAKTRRPTLIMVPTIDLLNQWQKTLNKFFDREIGGLGGGQRDLKDITVSTYESAHRLIAIHGNKFGFIIFDEVHHLPAPQYQDIARLSIAPFRLGLSATVERTDGMESVVYDLVGPLMYEGRIDEMVSKVLSPYDVVSIEVNFTDEEKSEYSRQRKIYTDFIRRSGINFSANNGWMDFVMRSSRSPEGRLAMKAYRRQKQMANGSQGKLQEVWRILCDHRDDKIIVFTDENKFAYQLGKDLILPVLTHHTKGKERTAILDAFRAGEFRVIVTSKILNEGVDVPDANVAIIMSGSGSVREHVQRLGRILRYQDGKRATLYEITSKGTGETAVSQRRRQHHAYQRSH